MTAMMRRYRPVVAAAVVSAAWASAAVAAPTTSQALAPRLVALMAERGLDSFATRDPDAADRYVAVMIYPHVQSLVVAGVPQSPPATQRQLDDRLYSAVYQTLHQAVVADSKFFVQDMHADGLKADDKDAVDIVYERVVKQTIFDGEPGQRHLSKKEYDKAFQEAEERYSRLLTLLVDALSATAAP